MGKIVGEEGNAQALVNRIDAKIAELRNKIPRGNKPVRVLYYDEGGISRAGHQTLILYAALSAPLMSELSRALNPGRRLIMKHCLNGTPMLLSFPGEAI